MTNMIQTWTNLILIKLLRISSYPHVFLGIRGLTMLSISSATVDLNITFENELLKCQ